LEESDKQKEKQKEQDKEQPTKDKDSSVEAEDTEEGRSRRGRPRKESTERSTEADLFDDLTAAEEAERDTLLKQGFVDWNRKDFAAFIKGCEKFGRDDIADIATEVEGKTIDEVKSYSQVFWKRYEEIAEWESKIHKIEEGEQRLKRRDEQMTALDAKIKRYKNPWTSLTIPYGQKKGKSFVEEEDVFLVCMTHKLGYGNWEALKDEIRRAWQFRFDWFLKSRTPQELSRRVDMLIRCIEKENTELTGSGSKVQRKDTAKAKETKQSPQPQQLQSLSLSKRRREAKKEDSEQPEPQAEEETSKKSSKRSKAK